MVGGGVVPAAITANNSLNRKLQSSQQPLPSKKNADVRSMSSRASAMNLEPAFPGAKHDVNGYCVRHSNVRLCQPVFAKDGSGDAAPVKYKAVRKICPQCGVQSSQNSLRRCTIRQSSNKELLPPIKESGSSMPHSPLPSRRKHGHGGSKSQKYSSAFNSEKEKDGDRVKEIRKEGGKEKIGDKTKERGKSSGKKEYNDGKKGRTGPTTDANNALQQNGTRGHQRSTHGQPKVPFPGKESKNALDPGEVYEQKKSDPGEVYDGKKHLDDNIPLTRSPNIPKYTVKVSRRGSQLPTTMKSMPFRKEDRGGNHGRERTTGVLTMDDNGLPLHNNDSVKESIDTKEPTRTNSNEGKKERRGSVNEQPQCSSNSITAGQSKKTLGTNENNPELNKLCGTHDRKIPGRSKSERGKFDLGQLWQSHDSVCKETMHDHNKHGSKVPSGTKVKECSDKKVFHRRVKVNESKDNKHLKGSFIAKETSKRTEKSSKEQSKVNSTYNNKAARHGGKPKVDSVKEKERHGSSAINQRSSRGRSSNDEKVRFQRGRSHSPQRRKKGDQSDMNTPIESKTKNNDYRRSKSMPQQNNQRRRVPIEYHHHKSRHRSTLSRYKEEFLEEMAQMETEMSVKSISIPTGSELTSHLPSKAPSYGV